MSTRKQIFLHQNHWHLRYKVQLHFTVSRSHYKLGPGLVWCLEIYRLSTLEWNMRKRRNYWKCIISTDCDNQMWRRSFTRLGRDVIFLLWCCVLNLVPNQSTFYFRKYKLKHMFWLEILFFGSLHKSRIFTVCNPHCVSIDE